MRAQDDLKEAIVRHALVRREQGAVIIHSEKSGDRSPWLFDFRALMLQPKWLDRYAELFWERYASHLPFQVGGMETAGISLVAAIVMKSVERGTPVNGFFIRKSRKRQGLMKQIEGTLTDEPIVLVDDLINTGSTFDKQLAVLSDAGKHVSDIFTLLSFRAPDAYKRFEDQGAHVSSLFSLSDFGIPLQETPAPHQHTYELVWRFEAPEPSFHLVVHKSSPVLDDKRVFFGTDNGTFYAIDKRTGTLAWKHVIGGHPEGKGILSSPALHNGVVYFGAYDGVVYALNAETGKEVWRYDYADWVGSSPALAPKEKLLFIGLEYGLWKKRGGIIALDMKTGREKWRATMPSLTHASPLYIESESLVIIGSNDGYVRAYDAVSGSLRWESRTEGDIKMAPAYDPVRRLVCVCSMDGKLYALKVDDGLPVFAKLAGGSFYSAPAVHGDMVYAASLDKKVYAVDLATGADRWSFATNGRIFASPAVFGDSVWIGSNDGKLYELDAAKGSLRGSYQLSERVLTRPAFDQEGHVYFGTVANELYCIKK